MYIYYVCVYVMYIIVIPAYLTRLFPACILVELAAQRSRGDATRGVNSDVAAAVSVSQKNTFSWVRKKFVKKSEYNVYVF